mmetsp:Transcript_11085/g.20043  ORF Transcript_11085/g.20043 Transcript_11085/m.20043 type:complete len:166 (+) Transcript_11085:178-675(+)
MAVTLRTNLGDLKLELFCEVAPIACENFLALCASNVYTNTQFFRNIPGFLIQGGDPTNTGTHNESIFGSPFPDEIDDSVTFNARGMIACANSSANNNEPSNGSQFFITYQALPSLNYTCTLFGRIIHGFPTLDKLEHQPTDPSTDRPLTPIVIHSITIHANPFAT